MERWTRSTNNSRPVDWYGLYVTEDRTGIRDVRSVSQWIEVIPGYHAITQVNRPKVLIWTGNAATEGGSEQHRTSYRQDKYGGGL